MKATKRSSLDRAYLNALSRVFTPLVLDSVAANGHSSYLTEVCANSMVMNSVDPRWSFAEFLTWVYVFLFKNYRNEYIYKNAIAEKILLGKHSLNTSHMLTEFRVGRCKADAVVINGTSTVYEIKSEFDSFVRLENQLAAYLQAFDHINVITSEPQTRKLCKTLPEFVGILVVTNRNTISTVRTSRSNKRNINPDILFSSLRKNEYLQLTKLLCGAVPDLPNTRIFGECRRLIGKANPQAVHDVAFGLLKQRSNSRVLAEYLPGAPSCLSSYMVSNANDRTKLRSLSEKFTTNISTILAPA